MVSSITISASEVTLDPSVKHVTSASSSSAILSESARLVRTNPLNPTTQNVVSVSLTAPTNVQLDSIPSK